VTPARFALFSARQYKRRGRSFPFRPWGRGDRIGWIETRSLATDEAAWAPAVLVLQPYAPFGGEPLIAPCLSTGLACGADWHDALARGLCEVIERDAVALAWLAGVEPPRLELDGERLGGGVRRLVAAIASRGFRWAAFDLTTDLGVPVTAALLEGRSAVGPVVSFGSAAHRDREQALLKALVEAAHARMYVKSILRSEPGWRAGRRCKNVTSFADHGRFYSAHPEQGSALARWWKTRKSVSWPEARGGVLSDAAWLREICGSLARAGHEVLAADLTTPDVEDLGLKVARVLVPGLQPLHGNHAWPHLGGPRLRELSRVFGVEARAPRRWNRYPHPCP
jgi:ribosomal protein S12 methylthiotransferase accessory factor